MLQYRFYIRKILLILILQLLFVGVTGCDMEDLIVVNTLPIPETTITEPKETQKERIPHPRVFTSEQDWEGQIISGYREGRFRQGIAGDGKTYDCNDNRVYFLIRHGDGALLCYGTHDSDLFLPLCQNQYCSHTQNFCHAKFGNLGSVGCYQESVYVSDDSKLYRLSPDGSERELLIDVLDDMEDYNGIANPVLWNGVFSFEYIPKLSTEKPVSAYYLLNESMEKPQLSVAMTPFCNEGDTFLVYSEEPGSTGLNIWNPNENSLNPISKVSTPKLLKIGYWGENARYYFREQTVYKMDYETGTAEQLVNTGLDGTHQLYCFPDCLLLCGKNEKFSEIYIYGWDNRSLGHLKLPENVSLEMNQIICGESRDRIYLAFHTVGVPEAFLNKYDFGKEKMELRWLEQHLPE